jgi:hypothetical protein
MLVVDRDSKALRHWVRIDNRLLEADTSAGVDLQAFDARLHVEGAALVVEAATGTYCI